MTKPPHERHLLFGVLALQLSFITRDQYLSALSTWLSDQSQALDQLLVSQSALDAEAHRQLTALVEKQLACPGGDPVRSLVSLAPAEASADRVDVQSHSTRVSEIPHTRPPSEGPGWDVPPPAARRFRRLQLHARGGLGEVFVAHDEELHRQVALKEIQERFADLPESRFRFLLEAEITGGLEHPGIVPVYGLGTYPDGRPFYTMRFIRGESLLDAIRRYHKDGREPSAGSERSLALRQLLRRFIDVCNALAYAHSRGVVHRDLKPDNVMLGPFGETLVVDWGLAKILGRADSSRPAQEPPLQPACTAAAPQTRVGAIFGTPEYMSPEQAAGRHDLVAAASDVYSLGALLYHLLTGRPPLRRSEPGELLKRIQQGDYPPPRAVRPEVPPALEAICLKAMALTVDGRYRGAAELADDIEHWLADEAVSAYREPVPARLGRWGRRHRALVGGLFSLLLTAVVALSASTYLIAEARGRTEEARQAEEKERIKAQLAAAEANQVSQFLVEVFQSADPIGTGPVVAFVPQALGERLTVRQVLDRGARRIATETRFEPPVRARLLSTIGNVYRSLGLYNEARPHLVEALRLRRQLDGGGLETAASLHHLGWWYHDRGYFHKAEACYREALQIRSQRLSADDLLVAEVQFHLGWVLGQKGEYSTSTQLLDRALESRLKRLGEGHRLVALTHLIHASLLVERKRFLEAAPRVAQAAALLNKLEGEASLGLLLASYPKALLLEHAGLVAQARQTLEDVLRSGRAVMGAGHPAEAFLSYEIGRLLVKQQRAAEGLTHFQRCLTLIKGSVGLHHPLARQLVREQAKCYESLGRGAEGEQLFEEMIADQRRLFCGEFEDERPLLADSLTQYAIFLYRRKKADAAQKYLREAIDIYRFHDTRTEMAATSAEWLAIELNNQGRHEESEALLDWGLQVQRHVDPHHRRLATLLYLRGKGHHVLGREAMAQELYRKALAAAQGWSAPDAPALFCQALTLENLGTIHLARQEFAEAERCYRDTLAVYARIPRNRENDQLKLDHCQRAAASTISKEQFRLASGFLETALKLVEDDPARSGDDLETCLRGAALVRLCAAEPAQYGAIVEQFRERQGKVANERIGLVLLQISLLGREVPAADAPALQTVADRVKAGTAQAGHYRLLAHANYRRKAYADCLTTLRQAEAALSKDDSQDEEAQIGLLTALALRQLGKPVEAQERLKRAVSWIEERKRAGWKIAPGDGRLSPGGQMALWLLRREAEELIGKP